MTKSLMNIIMVGIAILILYAAVFVVVSNNPVHSLLYLVLTFFNSSIILIVLNCEFLAMLFLIVYIGAIIVLFLFIVMMLNIKIIELNIKIIKYLPIGLFIILIFLIEIFYIVNNNLINSDNFNFYRENNIFIKLSLIEFYKIYLIFFNITAISQLLFNKFLFLFIIAGMILLVAMLGAILLTLNHGKTLEIENIFRQISQRIINSNKLIKIKPYEY